MNRLIDNHYVTEIKYGTNFAYILNDESSFLPTEYKMLQGQSESIFLKCMKMYYNGKIQLFYLTNVYSPLANILPRLNSETFLTVVSNLFGNIIEAKNHGFLSCKHIDISFDHIFIDPSTFKVKLVYIPASINLYDDNAAFETEIRINLIKLISEMTNISSTKTMFLSSDLQNGSVTLENIYVKLSGKSSNDVNNSHQDSSHSRSQLRLVAMDVQPRVEILVNKPEFVIGKKQSVVDGVVSFNKMISRMHSKVLCKQNRYYIEDLQSANGTYVNKVRLQPNIETEIKHGDIIRLANSNFQVVIS